jgi:hypothetical protein
LGVVLPVAFPHSPTRHALSRSPSATLEQVRAIQALDATQARLRLIELLEPAWRDLDKNASLDQASRAPCTPNLGAVGARVGSFLGLLAIWNVEAYARVMGCHLLAGRAAVGMDDARLSHWERCVRGAGLTKTQVGRRTGNAYLPTQGDPRPGNLGFGRRRLGAFDQFDPPPSVRRHPLAKLLPSRTPLI